MVVRLLGIFCLSGFLGLPSINAEEALVLNIVTYNIRYANPGDGLDIWTNRIDSVSAFLDQQDLAGLQEVTYAQLEGLRSRMTAFDFYGVGRDDGKQGGEHAAIFYRRERFEPIEQGTFWLSESPERVGVAGWDAALPRTCSWMTLRVKGTDTILLVANTHFDHIGAEARRESGKLLQQWLKERAGEMPVILLGDFNCRIDAAPYQALTLDNYLSDARAVSKTAPTGPESTWNAFKQIEAGQIIDHMFVHGAVDVLAVSVDDPRTAAGRFASDHLPVHALIGLTRGSDQE